MLFRSDSELDAVQATQNPTAAAEDELTRNKQKSLKGATPKNKSSRLSVCLGVTSLGYDPTQEHVDKRSRLSTCLGVASFGHDAIQKLTEGDLTEGGDMTEEGDLTEELFEEEVLSRPMNFMEAKYLQKAMEYEMTMCEDFIAVESEDEHTIDHRVYATRSKGSVSVDLGLESVPDTSGGSLQYPF